MAIHAFQMEWDEVQIWSDCESDSETDGRCLGSGSTFEAARDMALEELRADVRELEALDASQIQLPDVPGRRVGGMRRGSDEAQSAAK